MRSDAAKLLTLARSITIGLAQRSYYGHLAPQNHYYDDAINEPAPCASSKNFISDRNSRDRRGRYDKTLGSKAHYNNTRLVYACYCANCRRTVCLLLCRDSAEHRKQDELPTIFYLKAWAGKPTALDNLLESPSLEKPFARRGQTRLASDTNML